MGFFDIFKKKENNIPQVDNRPPKEPFEVSFSTTKDGRLQVDFLDNEAEFRNFYDTTRLIVDGRPVNIQGREVYNCMVSWYGKDDAHVLDWETGEICSPRSTDYREILAQIDFGLLQNDPNYCRALMKDLLDKSRVERYLENGLKECPETPCGNYIGEIGKTEEGYKKFFNVSIGKAVHNSRLMVERRQERREQIKTAKQKEIDSKKAQIAKLQGEIEGLSK